MQLESCIYTNLSAANPGSIVTVSQHHIPSALRELFRSYKESGHQMLRDAMTAMATCAGSGKDKQNGCSGHSYGLIECEPSGKHNSRFFFHPKSIDNLSYFSKKTNVVGTNEQNK